MSTQPNQLPSLTCGNCGSTDTDASGASGVTWCLKCESIVRSDDESDFARLDAVVAAGKDIFVKVGNALTEIQDRKLYRKEYATFPEYLEKRHGLKRSRAYQLMAAAAVAENVHHGGQTQPKLTCERQARELAKVEPAKQAEVWRKVNEAAEATGTRVTTATVRKEVELASVSEGIHAALNRMGQHMTRRDQFMARSDQHMENIRQCLREAKQLIPKRLWAQWLDEALDMTPRGAATIMRGGDLI